MKKLLIPIIFLFSVASVYAIPQFQNVAYSVANNSVYQGASTNYGFQVNVTDPACTANETTCISAVLIELNHTTTLTNYTATNSSANRIYTYNVTGSIPATNVSVKFYSNNSTGGINSANANSSTAVIYFNQVNNTPYVDLYINDQLNSNLTIPSLTFSNVSGVNRAGMGLGSGTLWRATTNVTTTDNNTAIRLGTATNGYSYLFNTTSNQNFTGNTTGVTFYLFVSAPSAGGGGGGVGIPTPPQACTCPSGYYSPDGVSCTFRCGAGQYCPQPVVPCGTGGGVTTPPCVNPPGIGCGGAQGRIPPNLPGVGNIQLPDFSNFGQMVSNFVQNIQNSVPNIGQQITSFIQNFLNSIGIGRK